ncbi:MAG: isomerizing glutamine--fructose-6-phosphate transaminase, partial [Methanobacteriota archaeon]
MCGIIGYIGERPAQSILLEGLKRLEYRGYDSSGICLFLDKKKALSLRKLPGKIKGLEALLSNKPLVGCLGIAHTRWATHGSPNQANAHPHTDCNNEIAIVHNGIIENYIQLKNDLIKEGHLFRSLTDTEVIAHLIEKFLKHSTLEEAIKKAVSRLEGSFAIALVSKNEPGKLIGCRKGSPLIVGIGKNENFLASDVPAILDSTRDVIFLEEGEMVVLGKDSCRITGMDGKEVTRKPTRINWDIAQAGRHGYKHFMLKEINEQPAITESVLKMRIPGGDIFFEEQKIPDEVFRKINNIVVVACGTAYHAGLVGKYIL